MNVQMDVRVLMDQDAVLDEQTKGHCLLSVGGKSIGNMRDHPRVFIYERCKYLRRYLNNHYWKS